MRAQLFILLLTAGLLGACSDSPEDKADRETTSEGDDVVLEDVPDTGRETSGPEAGQPVQGPLKKPEPAEEPEDGAAANVNESSASTGREDGGPPADKASESSGPDSPEAESARAPAEVYERYCTACHEKGMAGAPKISNTAEWQKRLDERGLARLVRHSVKGYRAMPARGTCMDCSEQELHATIEWMLDEAGVEK